MGSGNIICRMGLRLECFIQQKGGYNNMRSKIIKNGIVCGYITGTISCTMERDRHTKLKRILIC